MKSWIAAAAIAATTAAFVVPTPASAIGIYVGPRGGVSVGLGRPGYRGGYGYGRRFGPGFVVRPGYRPGYRWYRGGWRRY